MTDQAKLVEELQPFERFPELAAWIEKLANLPTGLTLHAWGAFLTTLNNALASKDGEIERLKYDFEDAAEHLANWRQKSLSLRAENERLRGALTNARQLIAEGAKFGFDPHVGDWAERLFFSQQKTTAALSRSTGDTK